jgi:hypothetical protein
MSVYVGIDVHRKGSQVSVLEADGRNGSSCAARKPGCGCSACAYSLIRAPRIGLRSTRAAST